jgi:hypothetical protein
MGKKMFQTTNQLNIFFGETNLMRKPRPLANTADEPHLHCMYSHLTSGFMVWGVNHRFHQPKSRNMAFQQSKMSEHVD